jgi:hypothetical protein
MPLERSRIRLLKTTGIELTCSVAYKHDLTRGEQKNGSIVRWLVGYGKLRSLEETEALASLYRISRLYINYFQPSFKQKSQTRHRAHVTERYEAPLTPLERVLRSSSIPDATKLTPPEQSRSLDPVDLLPRMREAKRRVAACRATDVNATDTTPVHDVTIAGFLASLGTA